ncbi:uncharacterized protein LOC128219645 isoform X1 [Mya arenaria]|uniref:uncharacterized protein LOC128219645 isoform X1 n=1 Tax=Mya arenaria TaxID=6604 RepID=UPI0022E7290B|nr:uncharacterized protein LOC128219645 isoform X1 [Mya arenaria]
MLFKYTLILVICIILIDPSDAKKEKKKSKKKEKTKTKTKEKRSVTDVEPPKLGCKAQFSVVCPVDMTAADVAIAGGTARTGAVVAAFAAAGVAVRKNACKVEEKNTCKRIIFIKKVLQFNYMVTRQSKVEILTETHCCTTTSVSIVKSILRMHRKKSTLASGHIKPGTERNATVKIRHI